MIARTSFRRAVLLLATLVGCVAQAFAQFAFDLSPSSQTGVQGSTVTYGGTLRNLGSETLYLNGTSFDLGGNGLTLDDGAFFDGSPRFLGAGETWTGDLFSVSVVDNATTGLYGGRFDILGGAFEESADLLGSSEFGIDVRKRPRDVFYYENFQGSVGGEWSNTSTTDVDGRGRIGLGDFYNDTVNLTLSGFTVGQQVNLAFDLYLLNSWDGSGTSGGPDRFAVYIGGMPLLDATFSVLDEEGDPQTYSASYPLGGPLVAAYTDADEYDTMVRYNGWGSAVYRFGGPINPSFSFIAASDTITISFLGSGIDDEGWAVDNVTVQTVPEPASIFVVGFGAVCLGKCRRAHLRRERATRTKR